MKKRKLFKTGLKMCIPMFLLVLGIQNSNAQEICITSSDPSDQKTGNSGGFDYELWNQNKKGTACMTIGASGCTFSGHWDGIDNYLSRRGHRYNRTQNHQYYGTFVATYDCDYNPDEPGSPGNSYLAVYGWTQDNTIPQPDDLVEWYIIEDWVNWIPSMGDGIEKIGSVNVSGETYDIYKGYHTGPTILGGGDRKFLQYFSIRQFKGSSGTIQISDHFYKWESLGMRMGKLHEVCLLVEGYKSKGSFNFTSANLTTTAYPVPVQGIEFDTTDYELEEGGMTILDYNFNPNNVTDQNVSIVSSDTNIASVFYYKGKYILVGEKQGSTTITITSLDRGKTNTANVVITPTALPARNVVIRALGVMGDEQINLLVNGFPTGNSYKLTKNYANYSDVVYGDGEISVEFINDVVNDRNVRLDYISIDGVKRETENMAVNTGAYANGVCGGGSYTEWLHCNGVVEYGQVNNSHTITIRARGNNGGEHMNLLINGVPVNGGWWLGTSFQEYSATVTGDGDINVQFDNDGGLKDMVVDWVRVDSQNVRQAENMQYNTGAWANGYCGGGSYTEWLHCNGVIGFGNISDNFKSARPVMETENESTFGMYPNPSITGSVTFELQSSGLASAIRICDVTGRVIYSREDITETKVSVNGLQSGIYIVNIMNNGKLQNKKLVVK